MTGRKGRITTAVLLSVVVLLVLIGGGVWLFGGSKQSAAQPRPTPAVSTSGSTKAPSSPSAPAGGSICGLPGDSTQLPATGPADVTWKSVDHYWIPISPTAGPVQRPVGKAWTCFAHTPTGALIAGWTIQSRLLGASDLHDVVAKQLVPGPGVSAAEALIPGSQPATAPLPVGFTFVSYTQEQATISYVSQQQGELASCTQQLQWYDGDWRQVVGPQGALTTGCQSAPAGYIPWSVS